MIVELANKLAADDGGHGKQVEEERGELLFPGWRSSLKADATSAILLHNIDNSRLKIKHHCSKLGMLLLAKVEVVGSQTLHLVQSLEQ